MSALHNAARVGMPSSVLERVTVNVLIRQQQQQRHRSSYHPRHYTDLARHKMSGEEARSANTTA